MPDNSNSALLELYAATWLDLATGESLDLACPIGTRERSLLARSALPERFVIITAFEPHPGARDAAHDMAREHHLRAVLATFGRPVVPLTGRSPDATHREPSFAVDLPVDTALHLARLFAQHAVFFYDGRTFAIHWTDGRAPTRLPLAR